MKKTFIGILMAAAIIFTGTKGHTQVFKIGVFDVDAMVTAMPAYAVVDSLLTVYQRDSLAAEYEIYVNEYQRLDSMLKFVDTPGVKTGAVKETKLKYDYDQKMRVYTTLVNWREIAQRKLANKKGILSQDLYRQVTTSYQKILKLKGYALVLKPGSYEYGTRIDNLFISVAKDIKLTSLPQELMVLGVDPDAPVQSQPKPNTNKPVNH